MSAQDFFTVVGRRSSVISLFRHRDGPVKNQIFEVFQLQALFAKLKIFRQNECMRFFRHRRSSPSSVVRHFPLSSQGRTCEKIKFSPFFKNKQSFQNSRFLGKMSARDFFAVVGRRLSVISLFRHRDGPVKKSNFRSFSKTSNLSKIQDF